MVEVKGLDFPLIIQEQLASPNYFIKDHSFLMS